jgi:hypothetical protein
VGAKITFTTALLHYTLVVMNGYDPMSHFLTQLQIGEAMAVSAGDGGPDITFTVNKIKGKRAYISIRLPRILKLRRVEAAEPCSGYTDVTKKTRK